MAAETQRTKQCSEQSLIIAHFVGTANCPFGYVRLLKTYIYGDGIQIEDAGYEYERLRQEQAVYTQEKSHKKVSGKEKISLPSIPKFHLPGKVASQKAIESVEQDDEI